MKKFLIGVAILIGICMILTIGWLGFSYLRWLNAPVYTFQQQLSANGKFMDSSLSYGNTRYVLTATEFSLVPDSSFRLERMIGRQGEMDIYTVAGKDDYITYSGFMNSPQVFRKEAVQAIDFATLRVSEIRYFGDQGGGTVRKTTQDPMLIQEVTQRLQATPDLLPGNNGRIDQIRIFSEDLPGLYDYQYVLLYPDQTVYFTSPADMDQGILAGPLFTQWIMNR